MTTHNDNKLACGFCETCCENCGQPAKNLTSVCPKCNARAGTYYIAHSHEIQGCDNCLVSIDVDEWDEHTRETTNNATIYSNLPRKGNYTLKHADRRVGVWKDSEFNDKFDIHFYENDDDGSIKDYAKYIGEDGWIGELDVNEVVKLVDAFLYRRENDIR